MNFPATMILGTTLALVLSTEPAQACSCAAPAGPADGLNRSTAVFRGRVSEIRRPFWDRMGLTNSGGYRVTFAVLKRWKGAPETSIELATRLTGEACGFPFQDKQEYLVYAVAKPEDLQTGICTGTKKVDDAAQEMVKLDEIVAAAKKSGATNVYR
jgi:hypothetical protein